MWVPLSLVCRSPENILIRSLPNVDTDIAPPSRQCLLDAYSMTECPNCGKNLIKTTSVGEQQLLCNLNNEGGLQQGLDILPILTEESYLKAYPEERKCRAFLEFCREGDIEAILELLGHSEHEEDVEDVGSGHNVDVLRYQDQIGSMESGLHLAVQSQRVEVAWLLLFMTSNFGLKHFPQEVLRALQSSELQREDQTSRTDIRQLRDAEGNTAEQRAASIGGIWNEWIEKGRLKPPEP